MAKRAFITGITGQDGSYLAELLLAKGYEVWGMVRRSSPVGESRLAEVYHNSPLARTRLRLLYGDLTDSAVLHRHLGGVRPDEIYNLGAQTHVQVSFQAPARTADVTGLGAARLLAATHELGLPARFYQAASSELFGQAAESPQNESTPVRPCNPYAWAKAYAYYTTCRYRDSHGMFAVNGVQYNHESPRRGDKFVTRKITRAAAAIAAGAPEPLRLGNLNAERDWGYAGDYVRAMWLMLQADEPADYVIGSGRTHSVRDFCDRAFHRVGIRLEWRGEGVDEQGVDAGGRTIVAVDPAFFRPVESCRLRGDSTRARAELGWAPTTTFDQLVQMMVDADVARLASGVRRQRAA